MGVALDSAGAVRWLVVLAVGSIVGVVYWCSNSAAAVSLVEQSIPESANKPRWVAF